MRKPRCHYRLHIHFTYILQRSGKLCCDYSNLKAAKHIREQCVEGKNVFQLDDMAVLFQQLMEYERGIPCCIRREYKYSKYYNPETQKPRGLEELVKIMAPRTYYREQQRRNMQKCDE